LSAPSPGLREPDLDPGAMCHFTNDKQGQTARFNLKPQAVRVSHVAVVFHVYSGSVGVTATYKSQTEEPATVPKSRSPRLGASCSVIWARGMYALTAHIARLQGEEG
ncbi:hypothetical protein GE21DRAFT_1223001, partial [Neurospora crassa]